MKCLIGVDLGSTTTKAVYLDEYEQILGKGITNSRSNYDLACQIAQQEAEIDTRFTILKRKVENTHALSENSQALLGWLFSKFKLAQHNKQLDAFERCCLDIVGQWDDRLLAKDYESIVQGVIGEMRLEAVPLFQPQTVAKSDFFRDIASSQYLKHGERLSQEKIASFDRMIGIYDKAIIAVEAETFANTFGEYLRFAIGEVVKMSEFSTFATDIRVTAESAANTPLEIINTIGTGYGRQRLPFPKHQIRSEILCHGLGAHAMYPHTRTVLDIGGQDTKAIQVDAQGIVTNFQMNDRCAAGCGRYLGYIADEMAIGVHELGPIAMESTRPVKINSTCTVFAGTELRERLALGEAREDIVAGLHRAIMLRAMSLLARSGGIFEEFTFTGGVAKNPAAVEALRELVDENYGVKKINISPNSIFTGAWGAALFAKRDQQGDTINVDLSSLRKKSPIPTAAQATHT